MRTAPGSRKRVGKGDPLLSGAAPRFHIFKARTLGTGEEEDEERNRIKDCQGRRFLAGGEREREKNDNLSVGSKQIERKVRAESRWDGEQDGGVVKELH